MPCLQVSTLLSLVRQNLKKNRDQSKSSCSEVKADLLYFSFKKYTKILV